MLIIAMMMMMMNNDDDDDDDDESDDNGEYNEYDNDDNYASEALSHQSCLPQNDLDDYNADDDSGYPP